MKLNRIKEVLGEKGVSQIWLAKKMGRSFSTVNAYSYNRKQPSLEILYRISKLLQVRIIDLIEDNHIKVSN
ncbi:MAG: helix-turn-helix transcriptional regulator [Prevotella sp.]|nr:helix-turn-helix transcriptional regulator [Prevotella sp.]